MTLQLTQDVDELKRSNELLAASEDVHQKLISRLETICELSYDDFGKFKKDRTSTLEKLKKDVLSVCPDPLKASTTTESIDWNWVIMRGQRRDNVKRKSTMCVG